MNARISDDSVTGQCFETSPQLVIDQQLQILAKAFFVATKKPGEDDEDHAWNLQHLAELVIQDYVQQMVIKGTMPFKVDIAWSVILSVGFLYNTKVVLDPAEDAFSTKQSLEANAVVLRTEGGSNDICNASFDTTA
ncbi:unnamed protein product [Taenia asiatica]|uniref:DUF5726 domain-containing protein n=1 Tax=Taenia asiatica TaxID=60517 RepID=A0A0R3W465_TAEAS|nr:unnamed protein product [Taenia asiatica]